MTSTTLGKAFRLGPWRSPAFVLCLVWLVVLVAGMLLLPVILGLDAEHIDARARLASPSGAHLFGADQLGRDLFARAMAGARISLLIGVGTVVSAAVIGVPLGIVAAYTRGAVSATINFIADVILAFPGLILALALSAFLGAAVHNVMIAIAVPMCPVFIRLGRAQAASVLGRDYVEASRTIGTPARGIIWRDVLPNIAEPVYAYALASVGHAILIEGGLSFLGIGVPSGVATWGGMINEGRSYIQTNPALLAIPAVLLLLTILSLNILSDRLAAIRSGAGRRW